MTYTHDHILRTIRQTGMMPVFYHPDADVVRAIIDCCYEEGIKIFEFTNRGPAAADIFEQLVRHVEQYSDFMLGIGTIMDAATTKEFIDLGAHFIVSPIINESMAAMCQTHDRFWIPGCATVTEIARAKECGAQVIKIFPASVLGPQFISSVMPVIQGLQLMPTGGIETDHETLSAWFHAGVICVGMGSQLFSKDVVRAKDWNTLRYSIAQVMKKISSIRSQNESLSLARL